MMPFRGTGYQQASNICTALSCFPLPMQLYTTLHKLKFVSNERVPGLVEGGGGQKGDHAKVAR